MIEATPTSRVRAFGYFVIAGIYFFFAQTVASHAAGGLVSGQWYELVERIALLFLLLVGYGAMGRAFDRQPKPIAAMGLVLRTGWSREFAVGAALGWGMMIAAILPMVLAGGLIVTVWTVPHQFGVLGIDVLLLAVAALGEEIVFRGYPFQRLIEVMGPFLATLVVSALFGVAHAFNPDSSRFSIMIAVFAGWLLSVAYLRTRALWLSWGWHFAWNASMGLLFGLPVSGITRFSPVIQSNTVGPLWITGGEYGPEASMVTALVMLIGLVVLFRITRDYAARYVSPAVLAAAPDHAADFPPKLEEEGSPALAQAGNSSADAPMKFEPAVEDSGVEYSGVEHPTVENSAVGAPAASPHFPSSQPQLNGGRPGQVESLPIPPDSHTR